MHIGRVHSQKYETCDEKFATVKKLERHRKVKTFVDNLGETNIEDGLELSKYRNDELCLAVFSTQK